MERSFDLVVIGTGAAGATVAHRCRSEGWEVAIVDSRPFGGTCALRGCDPKKVLVGAAEVLDWSRRMQGKGLRSDGLRIDWPALMEFKRSFTEPVPADRRRRFEEAGIAAFEGRARFLDERTLEVGEDRLVAEHFHIAAGARPAPLGIPGEDLLTTSTAFLELEELPSRLAFVGGGYISFEFAHVTVRAGAEARILHGGSPPLKGFDPDLVGRLVDASREAGVAIHLDARATAIEERDGRLRVLTSAGVDRAFDADLVVHGAGRVPEIDDLGLERAGVEWNSRGVVVNEYMQSVSNPNVYAAGDAAASGGPPLTPVAGMEGIVAASNLLGGNHRKPDYSGIPTVVFTVPPLAAVGLGEDEARERGLAFQVTHRDTGGWYSSRRVNEPHSAFKVLVEEESGRILGAHLLGPEAAETINLFALAIRAGLTADQLKRMQWAYPTAASDVSYMV